MSELTLDKLILKEALEGKYSSPSRKRACVARVRSHLDVSERRACTVVGQPRATQRRHLKTPDDEAALTADIMRLATQYGRYGYRRIREMLVAEGWRVNVKRVYDLAREGLKVPAKQPKRAGYGLMMGHASVSGLSGRTTSGHTILCRIAPTTAAPSACLSCSTSSHAGVWRSLLPGG